MHVPHYRGLHPSLCLALCLFPYLAPDPVLFPGPVPAPDLSPGPVPALSPGHVRAPFPAPDLAPGPVPGPVLSPCHVLMMCFVSCLCVKTQLNEEWGKRMINNRNCVQVQHISGIKKTCERTSTR